MPVQSVSAQRGRPLRAQRAQRPDHGGDAAGATQLRRGPPQGHRRQGGPALRDPRALRGLAPPNSRLDTQRAAQARRGWPRGHGGAGARGRPPQRQGRAPRQRPL